jgi:hypothetical protein
MLKSIYDTNGDGSVDNAEKLGGQLPEYYAKATDLLGKADTSHSQAASSITAGTLAGQVVANANAVSSYETSQVRNIKASTTDLTAGTSTLATGEVYFVYE